jgi:hypothetical protein
VEQPTTYKPETRNQKPETRNQKPETRNQKPETRNQKPETRNQKPEVTRPLPSFLSIVKKSFISHGGIEMMKRSFLIMVFNVLLAIKNLGSNHDEINIFFQIKI